MLEIGQLKCVSYGVVCAMLYCVVDSQKALISEDDCQERELHIETHPGHFWKFFSLIYARYSIYFMRFIYLFIHYII